MALSWSRLELGWRNSFFYCKIRTSTPYFFRGVFSIVSSSLACVCVAFDDSFCLRRRSRPNPFFLELRHTGGRLFSLMSNAAPDPASMSEAAGAHIHSAPETVAPFSKFALAVSVGTLGISIQGATPIAQKLNLRVAGNFFSYDTRDLHGRTASAIAGR